MSAGDWISWRLPAVAVALRSVAAALDGLADLLDPDEESPAGATGRRATGDAEAPRAGTRERIAATLQRARSQYDIVTAAPGSAKQPTGRLPRR